MRRGLALRDEPFDHGKAFADIKWDVLVINWAAACNIISAHQLVKLLNKLFFKHMGRTLYFAVCVSETILAKNLV